MQNCDIMENEESMKAASIFISEICSPWQKKENQLRLMAKVSVFFEP